MVFLGFLAQTNLTRQILWWPRKGYGSEDSLEDTVLPRKMFTLYTLVSKL